MKICTQCQTTFADPNLRFCGRDGRPLVEMPDTASQSQAPLLSGSLAMALFTSYFIETVEPNRGLNPPCQPDVEISTVQLYYELPIISLWYLREHNFIRFVQSTSPDRHSAVGIEAVQANHTSVPGLEFDYWEIIKSCAPGTPIQAVVRQLFGEGTFYPEQKLRERLAEWLVQLGYGQADNKPKPFFQFKWKSFQRDREDGNDGDRRLFEIIPDCQQIMTQQQKAQMILERWARFTAEEPSLYQWLFLAVVRAGDDACSSGKYRWSVYCSEAEKHHKARSLRSNAQTLGR